MCEIDAKVKACAGCWQSGQLARFKSDIETAIREGNAEALEGLTISTPVGKLTIDPKSHQANMGQFWGPMVKKPDRAYRMMDPVEYIQPK